MRFKMKRFALFLLVGLFLGPMLNAAEKLDLSAITSFAPKGRVQDKSYNPKQPVIDSLVSKGTNSIPLLIELLDNDTNIDHQVIDYWPRNTVGDIALVILTDFATGADWRASTIPGASWDEIFGPKKDVVMPAWSQLNDFKEKYGSKEIKRRWQKIWSEYHERIYWDAKDRCLKMTGGALAPPNSK